MDGIACQEDVIVCKNALPVSKFAESMRQVQPEGKGVTALTPFLIVNCIKMSTDSCFSLRSSLRNAASAMKNRSFFRKQKVIVHVRFFGVQSVWVGCLFW